LLVVLTIVAPVFGLIVIGYLAGRFGALSEAAGQGVSDYAFVIAMPALMFRTIATAKFTDVTPISIWCSYFLAAGAIWLTATLLTRAVLARPAADAPSIAMSSTFGNNIMLGIPLALATFGPAAAAPMALVLSLHAPLLWLAGSVHAEATEPGRQSSIVQIAGSLARDLIRNPIIIGIIAGTAWRLTGLGMPEPLDKMLNLLAQAGIPAALTALGLSLVKFEIKGQVPTLIAIVVLKLIGLPLLTWLLANYVFGLEPLSAKVITLLAAMPTGANAFLFATKQGRAVNSASGAVALGTMLAAGTSAVLITLLSA